MGTSYNLMLVDAGLIPLDKWVLNLMMDEKRRQGVEGSSCCNQEDQRRTCVSYPPFTFLFRLPVAHTPKANRNKTQHWCQKLDLVSSVFQVSSFGRPCVPG
ncbi:hypothetical protein DPMN_060092 [Dreissena polymorpha]|uniref:Uncharacterized protein n=1 Tax=Dreissena polymorpha TaxID=45954 RepID=A0A9D4C540_DREPO|nr:hypothetical protein DPMN_060092 [Dreissena polymorpha]